MRELNPNPDLAGLGREIREHLHKTGDTRLQKFDSLSDFEIGEHMQAVFFKAIGLSPKGKLPKNTSVQ